MTARTDTLHVCVCVCAYVLYLITSLHSYACVYTRFIVIYMRDARRNNEV